MPRLALMQSGFGFSSGLDRFVQRFFVINGYQFWMKSINNKAPDIVFKITNLRAIFFFLIMTVWISYFGRAGQKFFKSVFWCAWLVAVNFFISFAKHVQSMKRYIYFFKAHFALLLLKRTVII